MISNMLQKAEPDVQRLVNRISRMAGLDHKIEVYASSAPHACAISYKENAGKFDNPYITYNPVFLEQLLTVSPWTIVAVFAQEIACYYNNYQYKKFLANNEDNKNYKAGRNEIRPDSFTGWVLWHEGARLKEASALYALPKFKDSAIAVKPEKNDRKKMMRAGWIKAYGKDSPMPKRKPKQQPPTDQNGTDAPKPDTNPES